MWKCRSPFKGYVLDFRQCLFLFDSKGFVWLDMTVLLLFYFLFWAVVFRLKFWACIYLPTSMLTLHIWRSFGCAQLFITCLFSFSRPPWRHFFGHEEYLLYRNKERNFEVGTKTFPDLLKAPHFYLILIVLRLSLGGLCQEISKLKGGLFSFED